MTATGTPPSIDILLPFYGDVGFMKDAVRSIQAQTDPDWRLIVVDDHQPDESVADWFAGLADERIVYHRNRRNLGANTNYRQALQLATADLVVMMGADDLMGPDYVYGAKYCFERFPERVAMYVPRVSVVDEAGQPFTPLSDRVKAWMRPAVGHLTRLEGEALAISLLRGNWTYFPAICWRRRAVAEIGFRPGLNVVQDLALILDLIRVGHSMVLDPDIHFEYRRHKGSDSSVRALNAGRFAEERAFFTGVAREFEAAGWSNAARAARRHLTSRLNALVVAPAAARRSPRAALALLRHSLA